jgi:endonuclease/exonuclease/phosphatase (EEP) superfamily protein YafD
MIRFRSLFLLKLLGLSAVVAAGFLGFLHPAFDTLGQLRLHASAALFFLALGWRMLGCANAPAILFALVAFAGVAGSASGLAGVGARDVALTGENVRRLLQFNLRFDNPDHDGVLAMIGETDADILSLTEYSELWREPLAKLSQRWPHRYHCGEWGHVGGSAIFSKFPFAPGREYCGDYASLALQDMEIDGRRVTIGSAHLRWPWPASGPRQVVRLSGELRNLPADALIAGDFNAATWSHALKKFAETGKLETVAGVGPTWLHGMLPASLARYVGFPIDNVLAKGAVRIVSARTLAPAGSDHLPVLVEFVVRDTECCAKK